MVGTFHFKVRCGSVGDSTLDLLELLPLACLDISTMIRTAQTRSLSPAGRASWGSCRVVASSLAVSRARRTQGPPAAPQARIPLQRFAFSASPRCYSTAGQRPALFKLSNAVISGLRTEGKGIGRPGTLDLSIGDGGEEEAWAITGPAADQGGAVKAEVVKVRIPAQPARK